MTPQPQPRMRLTGVPEVALTAAVGAAAQAVWLWVLEATGRFAPVTPWPLPGLLFAAALAVFAHARSLRRRVADRSVRGTEAVRALALARAAITVGALVGGAHLLYVLWFVPRMAAEQPAARVLVGAVTTVTSALLVGAGMRLERACVDPHRDDEDDTPPV